MKDANLEKLVALRENECFNKEIGTADTPEKVRDVFAQYDVDLSAEEAEQVFEGAKKYEDNPELDEEMLEAVSGGALISQKELVLWAINFCCYCLGAAWYEYKEAKKTLNSIKKKKKK
jgi:hypothetical protein